MALSFEGACLKPGDTFTLKTAAEHVEGTLETVGPELLTLRAGTRTVHCRPWRSGDTAVHRLPGASSNWTVYKIETVTGADRETA